MAVDIALYYIRLTIAINIANGYTGRLVASRKVNFCCK
jgi:hypothetical protein